MNISPFTDIKNIEDEYNYIVGNKFGHKLYISNIVTMVYLLTANSQFCSQYGINFSLAFLSVMFYFYTYITLKRMVIIEKKNMIKFNIILSSLLAWSNILFYTALFLLIDKYSEFFDKDTINSLSLIMHLLIFCINVLLIVFCSDLFYTIVLMIYQIGITLQNKHINSNEDKFTLVITIMTGIILCWSIYSFFKKPESQNIAAEMKLAYDREKE